MNAKLYINKEPYWIKEMVLALGTPVNILDSALRRFKPIPDCKSASLTGYELANLLLDKNYEFHKKITEKEVTEIKDALENKINEINLTSITLPQRPSKKEKNNYLSFKDICAKLNIKRPDDFSASLKKRISSNNPICYFLEAGNKFRIKINPEIKKCAKEYPRNNRNKNQDNLTIRKPRRLSYLKGKSAPNY